MHGHQKRHRHGHGHGSPHGADKTVILLGNPNVGKSVIFGLLTGRYVTVSNYPGTTVEVMGGTVMIQGEKVFIIDTPGMNSLIPNSEDERVSRDIILNEKAHTVIQVADAKNLRRALFISLQLAEAGVPFVLDLNMNDEAASRGIRINREKLSVLLGIPVVETIATQRKGIRDLKQNFLSRIESTQTVHYGAMIENSLKAIQQLLPETNITRRFLALMLVSGDKSLNEFLLSTPEGKNLDKIEAIVADTQKHLSKSAGFLISQKRYEEVDAVIDAVMEKDEEKDNELKTKLGRMLMHPVWGILPVVLVMYLTYLVVGVFGAGICVDFLESTVFGEWINPFFSWLVGFIPVPLIQEFFIGDYGIITMALTYAIAIVLPIVGFFFIIFGLLEDSGYLPRLAIMVNRIFKVMGLNGKAILPMILGLGCDTMATMTARILPGKKERIIVTLLLALAIPCSAQLGVIFGTTSAISGTATLIWLGVIIFVIFTVGFLSSKIIPGDKSDFILEIPPLRVPKISNIIIKTLARLHWYLKEAVPLFVIGTVILFILYKTGGLKILEDLASPLVVNLLQLPREAAEGFIMGFLRRDFAIVLLAANSGLTPVQSLVGVVTITLFVPCVANLFIMIKERGWKTALLITLFIFAFAFAFGGLFNLVIRALGVTL